MSAAMPNPGTTVVTTTHGTGFAVTSMVLGILALVFSFIPIINVITFPLAVVALPLGAIAMKKTYQGHGMAITGLVTSLLSLGVVITMISVVANS